MKFLVGLPTCDWNRTNNGSSFNLPIQTIGWVTSLPLAEARCTCSKAGGLFGAIGEMMSKPLPLNWTTDHKKWYYEVYLKSDHWANIKARKLKANPLCERCGRGWHIDVHHVNYRHLFDVTLKDLLSLCRTCHKKEHEINGRPRREKISYNNYFPKEVVESIQESKLRLSLAIKEEHIRKLEARKLRKHLKSHKMSSIKKAKYFKMKKISTQPDDIRLKNYLECLRLKNT